MIYFMFVVAALALRCSGLLALLALAQLVGCPLRFRY